MTGSSPLGTRTGASSDDDPLMGLGNWMFTRMFNLLYGARYTDAMGIFRAWRKDLFKELDLDKEESHAPEKLGGVEGIGTEHLLSIRAAKRKLKITEIPGDEPKRPSGQAKLQVIRWGGAYGCQILRELWYWR